MTKVDKNRIMGNYGANLVAELLSRHCLVRPVVEGTDIGIDLYCETLEEVIEDPENPMFEGHL
ncbi:MAG: hypothetical protein JRJ02_12425 [Deltaproteobacteria bacterium]|nr:hypothetical protein [Deltaproteobacteria bacterium]